MEEGNKKENARENEVIQISYGNNKNAKKGDSLQEAFKKFRKERQVSLRKICNFQMKHFKFETFAMFLQCLESKTT